jgi:hypothetical protein
MHTANDRGGIPLSSLDGTDRIKTNSMTKIKRLPRDSESEEAILFERSVQVTYEDAYRDGSSDIPLHQPKVWTT